MLHSKNDYLRNLNLKFERSVTLAFTIRQEKCAYVGKGSKAGSSLSSPGPRAKTLFALGKSVPAATRPSLQPTIAPTEAQYRLAD